MPEYLAPGVYVEETSFRAKSIEGVSTSTAGFIGPARFGPIKGEPELITSFANFARIYGGLEQLEYTGKKMHNYLAHAVRSFFEEGGSRLYVTRVFGGDGGHAHKTLAVPDKDELKVELQARHPGAAGNMQVTFTLKFGLDVLGQELVDAANPASKYSVLRGASEYDLVWVGNKAAAPAENPEPAPAPAEDGDPKPAAPDISGFYWVERFFDGQRQTFRLRQDNPGPVASALSIDQLDGTKEVRLVTVNVKASFIGPNGKASGDELVWEGLTFHPAHAKSLAATFAEHPSSRATLLYVPLVVKTELQNGKAILDCLLAQQSLTRKTLADVVAAGVANANEADLTFRTMLEEGHDGYRPKSAEYEGSEGAVAKTGFKTFEDLEDISIVAAPGSTFGYGTDEYGGESAQIQRLLIAHATRMRYRIAVLDSVPGQLISEVRAYRAQLDSTYAALYYPWIRTQDPVTGQQINLPPSGFVAGIYARNDTEKGVHKAPANEVVRSALGFEVLLNKAQQDVLNPEGVNCFRYFEGRGFLLWGARTISSDPEWKYVNLRRYFAYLERSIDKSTQWAVFMNNGETLWAKVKQTIEDFLFTEWKNERLMGSKPDEAYFVRCDRSTMTQNDLDNGRMICLIGVAPFRPAEYVIFRIGQKTANS